MADREAVERIKTTLSLIEGLGPSFGVERSARDCKPLLYAGVARSDILDELGAYMEEHFGKPYKAAGEGAFFKNLLDGFVKDVGGIRREQTLYRRDVAPGLTLWCAFWPWGSNPVKTSVRIGLLCKTEEQRKAMARALKGCFR